MPGEAGWKDWAGKPEEVCTTNQGLPTSAQPAAGCKGKTGCTPRGLRCGSCTVCLAARGAALVQLAPGCPHPRGQRRRGRPEAAP